MSQISEEHERESDGGFTLDTSGCVWKDLGHDTGQIAVFWTDLDPFTQGYVEALLVSIVEAQRSRNFAGRDIRRVEQEVYQRPDRRWREYVGCGEVEVVAASVRYNPDRKRSFRTGPSAQFRFKGKRISRDAAARMIATWNSGPSRSFGFSDLSREALAMILRDCAAFQERYGDWPLRVHGSGFWKGRQKDRKHAPHFPPLTITLGDDGRVHLDGAS